MKIFYKISLIFLLVCFGLNTLASEEQKKQPARIDFNGYLASRYFAYSQYKAENGEWKNSRYFSRKAQKASRNKEVYPEELEKWQSKFILQNVNFNEFVNARKDLEVILSRNEVKETYPLETANLQFLYDCWLSEESSYEKFDQISKCKVKFFVLKDYIEEIITPKEIITIEEENEYLIGKRYIADGVEYNIYFDFDSYKLNRNANQTIKLLLNFLNTMEGDYKLTLEGHTDRVGKKLYNESLARKRVLTVKNKLQRNGVPKDIFTIASSGEENPKIITKNEQREKLNRRVSIKVLDLNGDFSPIPLPLD